MARQKTNYPGVFFKEVRRVGGKGAEKSYYIIFKLNGKNVEEHVGYQYRDAMTPSKAAQIRNQRIENRRQSKKEIRAESEWTFQKLWDKYVEHRKRKNKGAGPTRADVSRWTFYLKDTIGHIVPGNLKPAHLDPVHEKLYSKAAGTKYSVLQLINRLGRFGHKQQLTVGISFHIELPKVDVERTEQLSESQIINLLEVLHADGSQVAQLMELCLMTGMRRGELLKLEWEDVHLDQAFLTIRKPKGEKTVSIPLNDAAKSVLEPLRKDSGSVFDELQNRSEQWIVLHGKLLIAKAGLPDDFRPFHGLRHSFASALASAGVPLFHVSQLLTHKSLQMTQRYSHLSNETLAGASSVISDIVKGNGNAKN